MRILQDRPKPYLGNHASLYTRWIYKINNPEYRPFSVAQGKQKYRHRIAKITFWIYRAVLPAGILDGHYMLSDIKLRIYSSKRVPKNV